MTTTTGHLPARVKPENRLNWVKLGSRGRLEFNLTHFELQSLQPFRQQNVARRMRGSEVTYVLQPNLHMTGQLKHSNSNTYSHSPAIIHPFLPECGGQKGLDSREASVFPAPKRSLPAGLLTGLKNVDLPSRPAGTIGSKFKLNDDELKFRKLCAALTTLE